MNMKDGPQTRNLPDANQLSILVAGILLAYAITPYIKIPEQGFRIPLPGIMFDFNLNFPTLVSFFVAALAALGSDWLMKPRIDIDRSQAYQHWILPALTAWVIGFPLTFLDVGIYWWAVFFLGGLLLVVVLVAEYIVVDLSDRLFAPASAALVAVSYALFLFLSITIRATGLRLYVVIPALFIAVSLVTLRSIYLRTGGRWEISWAILCGIIISQFAIGFHYLPINAVHYGLFLLGPAYFIISLACQIKQNHIHRGIWIEPSLMLIIFWVFAFVIKV